MTSRADTRRPGFGLPGLVVTCIGAGGLLVAFLVLDWFEGIDLAAPARGDGGEALASLTLREAYVASEQSRLGALVHRYVAWLGWTLAFASSRPGPRSRQWRAPGVVAGT